jgi:hypothetical protein
MKVIMWPKWYANTKLWMYVQFQYPYMYRKRMSHPHKKKICEIVVAASTKVDFVIHCKKKKLS